MATPTILTEIKRQRGRVFRRLKIKRRLASTGLFETDWQDISADVKSWGHIQKSIDHVRYARPRFSDVTLLMANDAGLYNPEDDETSLWAGYASQQRTLVKIEAGFVHQTLSASGIWTNTEFPTNPTIFVGVIQGDISISDDNHVALPVKPLLQVFRDFSCRNLTGLTTTGMTASQFIQTLRDQTDGSANFIFRPFFQDTTTMWEFTSSAIVYADINSNPASAAPSADPIQNEFLEMDVWEAIEKLAEAENSVPYITRDGAFRFQDREVNSITAAFAFFGRGYTDQDHGQTIKKVNSYKTKTSDFYSRVEVKWSPLATTTAIVSTQTAMTVGDNNAWNYGHRTFRIENNWLATSTSANALASSIFAAVSAVPREVDFATSFVPHLEVLDLVTLNYDSGDSNPNERWDLANWATEGTQTAEDLFWAKGNALNFAGDEFKLTFIDINLDALECRFMGLKTGGTNFEVGGNTVGSAIVGDAIVG